MNGDDSVKRSGHRPLNWLVFIRVHSWLLYNHSAQAEKGFLLARSSNRLGSEKNYGRPAGTWFRVGGGRE
jgi:hypothetical protein